MKPEAAGEEPAKPTAASQRGARAGRQDRLRQDRPANPRAADAGATLRRPAGRQGRAPAGASKRQRRARVPTGTTVHRYDLRQRRGDVLASGVRFFELSANGEKDADRAGRSLDDSERCGRCRRADRRWPRLARRPAPPRPAAPALSRCAPTTSKCGRTRRRVEADVPRRLADPARVLLRSQSPRPRSRGRDQDGTSRTSRRSSRAAT